MQLFPFIAIIVPLLGVGGVLGLSRVPRVRTYTRYVALAAVSLTTVSLLASRWIEPRIVAPSLWQPSLLFGATLTLQIDAPAQPLALALALMTCCTLLVDLSRSKAPSPLLVTILQALLAAGILTLWAANTLTTLISWAIYDLLQAVGHLASGKSTRTAIRSLVFSSLATLLFWGGTLVSGGETGSELWSLMTPGGTQMALWAMAGLLRLWAYPFHLAVQENPGDVPPLSVPLSLGPMVGWGLWIRLALANGGFIPGGVWVPILGAVNLGFGGFLAWCCESPRRMLSWIGMAANGAILLSAGLAGANAAGFVTAGSVAWAVGMSLISLGDGLQWDVPWQGIPSLVGASTLLGLPLTLGFVTGANLVGGLARGGSAGLGGAFFLGNVLLIPAMVRWLLNTPVSPWPTRRGLAAARGIGLGLPVLLLILAGLHPPLWVRNGLVPSLGRLLAMPSVVGWLLWMISLAGGGVLAWQDAVIYPKVGLLLRATHDLLSLEWLWSAVAGALDRGLGVLRTADEVVGGGGALLWSWLLLLLLLLVWGSG